MGSDSLACFSLYTLVNIVGRLPRTLRPTQLSQSDLFWKPSLICFYFFLDHAECYSVAGLPKS